jgi:hypothetical protein
MSQKRGVLVEKTDIRFPAGTNERVRAVAATLDTKDQVVMRALVLEGLGIADPVTAQIAQMIRDAVRASAVIAA